MRESSHLSCVRAIFINHHLSTHSSVPIDLLVVLVGVDVGEPALAAVLSVEVGGHEDAGAALLGGALPEERSRVS